MLTFRAKKSDITNESAINRLTDVSEVEPEGPIYYVEALDETNSFPLPVSSYDAPIAGKSQSCRKSYRRWSELFRRLMTANLVWICSARLEESKDTTCRRIRNWMAPESALEVVVDGNFKLKFRPIGGESGGVVRGLLRLDPWASRIWSQITVGRLEVANQNLRLRLNSLVFKLFCWSKRKCQYYTYNTKFNNMLKWVWRALRLRLGKNKQLETISKLENTN
ncbi:hypothetical protein L484_004022 [Morus notabilis]|uniref:Uncharacterized protein n=1 Tax=Morus notabilis TaxID=981085 RepID=W9RKW1_9ROSA|nr:hypothetical protein L484_004022 [Morus notabilis]